MVTSVIWDGGNREPLRAQVASTFYSTVSAVTSRAEADAAFLENEAAQRAMQGMEANVDTGSAVLSDFRELKKDFSSDEFTDGIRNQLQGLEVEQVREFRGLSREQRRKVHLLAGELGMLSQSFSGSSGGQRTVVVTNPPSKSRSRRGRQTIEMDVKQLVAQIGEEVKEIQGTLQQSEWQVVSSAGVLVLGSVLSPWLLGKVGAELFLPLATGTVGLATAWQETAGKGAVAVAKRQSAFLLTKEARAETFLGRGYVSYAAFPTDVALATLATVATGLSGILKLSQFWKSLAGLMVIPAYTACSVAMIRRRKVERFVAAAMRCVDAKPMPAPKRFWKEQLERIKGQAVKILGDRL